MSRLSPQEQAIVNAAASSSKAACVLLSPDAFRRPFSPHIHDKIFELFDSPAKLCALSAPRGAGKTTVLKSAVKGAGLSGRFDFVLWVSASQTIAEQQTEAIKADLENDPFITKLYGPQKTRDWSIAGWTAACGLHVVPRGAGSQVRGLNWRNKRPKLIVVDDLEDDEGVMNEDRRKRLMDWFYKALMPCVDEGCDDYKIFVLGTIMHQDSLLKNLMEDESYHRAQLRLCDDQLNTLWPEFSSSEQIKAKADVYRRQNRMWAFWMEYCGLIRGSDDGTFRADYFRTVKADEVNWRDPCFRTAVLADPAKTATPQSDDSAAVVISIHRRDWKLYVRKVIRGKFYPDQFRDAVIDLAMAHKANLVGVESNSLGLHIMQPFQDRLRERCCWTPLVELKTRNQVKEERIAALLPYYRSGQVYHVEGECNALEMQLIDYPRSKNDDVMDATAYIVELLSMGEFGFDWADPNGGTAEEIEREYASLSEGALPTMPEWRSY